MSDIPRLYRRTNREIPSKPCTYLVSLLDPIENFAQVSAQFLAQVRDILESVEKIQSEKNELIFVIFNFGFTCGQTNANQSGFSVRL